MSRFLIAALAVLTAATTSFAQGIIAPTAGPINSSIAGASVAAPVDFGGSYWNPAILSGLPRNEFLLGSQLLPRQESFASLHILTRRASEGSEALPSLARRVRMSFFGARVILIPSMHMTSSLPARAIDGVFPPDQSIRRGPQRQPRRLEPCHGRFLPPQRRFEDHFRNRRVRAGGWRRQLCRQQHDPDPDPTAASELFRGRTDLLEHIISCNHANGVTTSDRPAGHRRWTDDRDRPDGLQSGLLRSRSEGRDRPAHVPRRDQRAAVLGSRISDRSALQPQRELEPGFLVQEPDLARAVWLQCFHSRPGRAGSASSRKCPRSSPGALPTKGSSGP